MSAVCILAPAVVAGWPAISAAAAGAAAALGLHAVEETRVNSSVAGTIRSVELEIENTEVIGESLAQGQTIVLEGQGMTLKILVDERGQVRICVEGAGRSKAELEAFGKRMMDKMAQVFIYNKLMEELRKRDFEIVTTEVADDETVHIRVRHDA